MHLTLRCLVGSTYSKAFFSAFKYELSIKWTIVPGELRIIKFKSSWKTKNRNHTEINSKENNSKGMKNTMKDSQIDSKETSFFTMGRGKKNVFLTSYVSKIGHKTIGIQRIGSFPI